MTSFRNSAFALNKVAPNSKRELFIHKDATTFWHQLTETKEGLRRKAQDNRILGAIEPPPRRAHSEKRRNGAYEDGGDNPPKRPKHSDGGSENATSWTIKGKSYDKATLAELFPDADFRCFCCQAAASPDAETRFRFCPQKSEKDHSSATSRAHRSIKGLTGGGKETFAILDKCLVNNKNNKTSFRRG
jgi:hypothetical protein